MCRFLCARLVVFLVLFSTFIGATDYYVATNGNNANNGLTPTSAFRTITHAVYTVPNGTPTNVTTIHVLPGVYENDNRLLFGGRVSTNWYIHFNNRQWVHVIGAGPGKSILASGTNSWYIQRDTQPSLAPNEAPIYFRNVRHVRFSGFTIIATNPPATLNDRSWYPDFCTLIAVKGADGLRIDNLILDGRYDGPIYVIKSNQWSTNWDQWYFHAIQFDFGTSQGGIIGTNGVRVDHVLSLGFQRFAYMNCYSGAGTVGNTNVVTIDHCTILENIDRGSGPEGVFYRHGIAAHPYTAKYLIRNNIVAFHPRNGSADPLNSDKFFINCDADAVDSFGIPQIIVYHNQLYAIGLDPPHERWYSAPSGITEPEENYYGEEPFFFEYAGVPYSTDGTNAVGRLRDVGWNPIIPTIPLPRAEETNLYVSMWRTNGTLTIYNDGVVPFAYAASVDVDWLHLHPAFVSNVVGTRMDIPFTINRAALAPGVHRATVTLTCGSYGTFAYSIRYRVRNATAGLPYVYGLHMTTINTNGAKQKFYQDTMFRRLTPNPNFDGAQDLCVLRGFYTFGNSEFTNDVPYSLTAGADLSPAQYEARGAFYGDNGVYRLAPSTYELLNPVTSDNNTAPVVSEGLSRYVADAMLAKEELYMELQPGVNRFTIICPAAGEITYDGMIGLFLFPGALTPVFAEGSMPTLAALYENTPQIDAVGKLYCGFTSRDAAYFQVATKTFPRSTLVAGVGSHVVRVTHFSVAGINNTSVNPVGLTGPACPGYVCEYTHATEYNAQWAIRPGGENAVAYLELTVEPAQMVVLGKNKPVVSGFATPTWENGTEFGPVDADGAALTNSFVIYNASGSNLMLTAATPVLISGGDAARFSVIAQPHSIISPFSSSTFAIVFSPLSKDAEYGSSVVISNNTVLNPFTFLIHGGIPEPTLLGLVLCAAGIVQGRRSVSGRGG
ncbi:MAG: hypothetical protein N2595_06300 [bacterium]|nr:hypothetical protein [bacterium]